MVPVITRSPKRLYFVFLIYDVLMTNLIVSLSQLTLCTTYSTAICYSYVKDVIRSPIHIFYNKPVRDLGIGRNVFQTIMMLDASWKLHCHFTHHKSYILQHQWVSLFDGNMPVYFVGIITNFGSLTTL